MKKNLFSLSALCLAAMTLVFSGCKKENNDPQEPAKVQTYKMSIQALKGVDSQANGPRRVLSLDGTTLNAAWQAGEQVSVYNATKNAELSGYLVAEASGANVQLTGELTGTIEAGDKLTLKYLSPSYATQAGTIEYISANCDYAVAENVEVTSISGETIYTVGEAAFENRQAIVKFTLKNEDGTATIAAKPLVIEVEGETYTVTPASATSEMFVALPGFEGKTVTLTATVGSDTYAYEKTGAAFENGKFYQITAKMTKQAPAVPAGALTGEFTVDDSGTKVTFSQGNLQYNSGTQAWQFAENQYDYVGNVAGNTNIIATGKNNNTGIADLFGWVGASSTWTGLAQNGLSSLKELNSTNGYGNDPSEALKSDWGTLMGTVWFTLSTAQWQCLFNTRSGATVNGTANARYTEATINTDGTGVNGIILFPDDFDVSETDGVTTWGTINGGSSWGTKLTSGQWNSFEEAGCVFLPAAGERHGTSVYDAGSYGGYWSSSPNPSGVNNAYGVYFSSNKVYPASYYPRYYGFSVRLVRLVE